VKRHTKTTIRHLLSLEEERTASSLMTASDYFWGMTDAHIVSGNENIVLMSDHTPARNYMGQHTPEP
jgi:hypothetical protein